MSAEDAASQGDHDEETYQPGAPAMLEKLEVCALGPFTTCVTLIMDSSGRWRNYQARYSCYG